MIHATTLDAIENPDLAFLSPDVANAYNELDREECIEDLIEWDDFAGLTAAAVYTVETVYVYIPKDGRRSTYRTLVGVIQGDPIGMNGFCMSSDCT